MSFLDNVFGSGAPAGNDKVIAARQRGQVTNATDYITSVFEGGSGTQYTPMVQGQLYDPSQNYYIQDAAGKFEQKNIQGVEQEITPGNIQKWEKMGRVFTGTPYNNTAKYDQNYFNKIASDYVAYYMPQLAKQVKTGQDATQYALANRGVLDSSIASKATSDFNRQANLQQQAIVDAGTSQGQQLQQQMQTQESNLIGSAQQAIDPQSSAKRAAGVAASYSIPNMWGPLINYLSPSTQAGYFSGSYTPNYSAGTNWSSSGATGASSIPGNS